MAFRIFSRAGRQQQDRQHKHSGPAAELGTYGDSQFAGAAAAGEAGAPLDDAGGGLRLSGH